MHLYHVNLQRLRDRLADFSGGQFLMETKEGLVFRGEVSRCFVPEGQSKQVSVFFNWLSERRFVLDAGWSLRPKWFPLQPPNGLQIPYRLDLGYSSYYYQPDEDRVKMWGERKEVCHFFMPWDHTNLVLVEGRNEFVPYCELPKAKAKLQRLAIAILLKR